MRQVLRMPCLSGSATRRLSGRTSINQTNEFTGYWPESYKNQLTISAPRPNTGRISTHSASVTSNSSTITSP
ncbi:Uncharacterised protein [Bordetella pertussis]|nr:Uncharacterised protein [Bordetella pertussis]